jgi:hypothetical protein
MQTRTLAAICLCFVSLVALRAVPAAAADGPDLKEVYDLLRANLPEVSQTELDRAAALGLIQQLAPRVRLAGTDAQATEDTNEVAKLQTAVFDSAFGYLRTGSLRAGADQKAWTAYQKLASANRLKGLVLDLRFAGGDDYGAAVAVADWFLAKEEPLLDWGDGLRRSTVKTNALRLPVAVLINRGTSGAAEALAGVLRASDMGLLIGATTAGLASPPREFTLKTGERLLVAVPTVKVGKGQLLTHTGVKPDLLVEVDPEDEMAFFQDAFRPSAKSGLAATDATSTNEAGASQTNRARRSPRSEAELVRMLREEQSPEEEPTAARRRAERNQPLVQDPVLARALDLLKGLAVVQPFRGRN